MPETPKTFSTITTTDVKNYLRLSEVSQADEELLSSILEASKSYVLTYTGRSEEDANTFPEFVIAVYVLCEDMFDKRAYSINKTETNQVVESILGMRSINLL